MLANGLVIIIVLGLTFVWGQRGAFSAFLHLVAVVAGGAIALGLWEPAAMFLLDAAGSGGQAALVEATAFPLSLWLIFAVSTILIRAVTDSIIRGNLTNAGPVDFGGGAVLGLLGAVLTAGIIMIGLNYARLTRNMVGYEPVRYSDAGGSLVRNDAFFAPQTLWLPVDRITAEAYRFMSLHSLATTEPLARWHPDLESTGFATRINYRDGQTRNVIPPDAFAVIGRYRLGSPAEPLPAAQLLTEFGRPPADRPAIPYRTLDDEPVATGHIEGIVLSLKADAKEKNGQFIYGNGQTWMLARRTGTRNETISLFPVAMVSRGLRGDAGEDREAVRRWGFDGPDVFIASPGGATDITVAFEFLVPAGYEPLAVTVKNVRSTLDPREEVSRTFRSPVDRDRQVARLLAPQRTSLTPASGMITVNPAAAAESGGFRDDAWNVRISTALDITFNKQYASGLTLDDSDANKITGGELKMGRDVISNPPTGPDGARLRVNAFKTSNDRVLVWVNIGPGNIRLFDLIAEQDRAAEIALIDADGIEYAPVGFVFRVGMGQPDELAHIRFTPDQPIRSMRDFSDAIGTNLSKLRRDQQARLLFEVTAGATLRSLAVGETEVLRFEGQGLTVRSSSR